MVNNMLLKKACAILAVYDEDGATKKNNVGFNKTDSEFGRRMSALPSWTPRQAAAVYNMLKKYRDQLTGHGINFDDIPIPAVEAPCRMVDADGNSFILSFPYDFELKEAVKTLPSRRWDGNRKAWVVAGRLAHVSPLEAFAAKHDFTFTDRARTLISRLHEDEGAAIALSKADKVDNAIAADLGVLQKTPRPFQIAGITYAAQKRRVLMCDDMGLGKTMQALLTLKVTDAFPALIIVPATLKINWQREASVWLPDKKAIILNGKAITEDITKYDLVIINYDILTKWYSLLAQSNFKGLVCDESHYLKNYKAQRTETVKKLAPKIPVRLLLTGTPVLNRPQELLSQLGILGRLNDFGGFWKFAERYCAAVRTRWGWDFSGASNLTELNNLLRASCFVRRTKDEVLKELPAKNRVYVPVDITNRSAYCAAEQDIVHYIAECAAKKTEFLASIEGLSEDDAERAIILEKMNAAERAARAEQLVRIEALKKLTVDGKMPAIIEWIDSFLESNEKLIVFAHHRETVVSIAKHYNAPYVTGDTTTDNRQAAIDAFQNDPATRIIVLNMQAGGVGITLTAASNVLFLELGWTPALHDQAEDRAHRIGQAESVTAWYLLASETIDEEIAALLDEKRTVVTAVTDGADINVEDGILVQLLENLSRRKL